MENTQAPPIDLEIRTKDPPKTDNTEPVTGLTFTLLLMSLTVASLLVFLDTSVVSTVRMLAIKMATDSIVDLLTCSSIGSPTNYGRVPISS